MRCHKTCERHDQCFTSTCMLPLVQHLTRINELICLCVPLQGSSAGGPGAPDAFWRLSGAAAPKCSPALGGAAVSGVALLKQNLYLE